MFFNFCLHFSLRKFDYENFLCTLLINGESRRDALAIRAFNVEIAKIPTAVDSAVLEYFRSMINFLISGFR